MYSDFGFSSPFFRLFSLSTWIYCGQNVLEDGIRNRLMGIYVNNALKESSRFPSCFVLPVNPPPAALHLSPSLALTHFWSINSVKWFVNFYVYLYLSYWLVAYCPSIVFSNRLEQQSFICNFHIHGTLFVLICCPSMKFLCKKTIFSLLSILVPIVRLYSTFCWKYFSRCKTLESKWCKILPETLFKRMLNLGWTHIVNKSEFEMVEFKSKSTNEQTNKWLDFLKFKWCIIIYFVRAILRRCACK